MSRHPTIIDHYNQLRFQRLSHQRIHWTKRTVIGPKFLVTLFDHLYNKSRWIKIESKIEERNFKHLLIWFSKDRANKHF